MAITKRTEEDKIEIVGQFKHIQVRTATVIEEDGVELSRSFHRHTVAPGDDVSEESAEVQAIAAAVHTSAVVDAYNEHVASQVLAESEE
jgi:hypothetical protein